MIEQILWFSAAVLPLILTPGPDILYCVAQGITRGPSGVWRAVNGIALGYFGHALLATFGLATLVAASPLLFDTVRWLGIGYLLWLAIGMLRSALSHRENIAAAIVQRPSIWRGFLTSFLNPKGLLMYLSILPQFMLGDENTGLQALTLSAVFIFLCYVVYTCVGLFASRSSGASSVSPLRTRFLNGIAGTMLGGIAIKLAIEK